MRPKYFAGVHPPEIPQSRPARSPVEPPRDTAAGVERAPRGRTDRFVTFNAAQSGECDMELRVIEKTDTELSIEIAGEDHTFMNVLKGALLETEGVEAATYDMNPEQSGGQTDPILTIKTGEEVDALDALEAGADRVMDKTTNFKDSFQSAA